MQWESKEILEKLRKSSTDKNNFIYSEILSRYDSPRILDCDSPENILLYLIQDDIPAENMTVIGKRKQYGIANIDFQERKRQNLEREGVKLIDFDFDFQDLSEVLEDNKFEIIIADGTLERMSTFSSKKLLGTFYNHLDRLGTLILVANARLQPGVKIWNKNSIIVSDSIEAIDWLGHKMILEKVRETSFDDQSKLCFINYVFKKV